MSDEQPNRDTLLARCKDACLAKDWARALVAAAALTQRFPDDPDALAAASAGHRVAWRFGDAVRLAEAALRIDPRHRHARYALALAIVEMQDETQAPLAVQHLEALSQDAASAAVHDGLAQALILAGRATEAVQRLERLLGVEVLAGRCDPAMMAPLYLLLSRAHAASGDVAAASQFFARASAIDLTQQEYLSTTAMLMMRSLTGPTERRPRSGRPVISIAGLTHVGRLGHQIQNYVVARLYAERFGFELHTADWMGHFLFDLSDPLDRTHHMPICSDMGALARHLDPGADPASAADPPGDTRFYSPAGDFWRWPGAKTAVQAMLRVRDAWRPRLDRHLAALARHGRTCVAVHIRLGDLRLPKNAGVRAPDPAVYLDWLAGIWDTLDAPVLYVASDEADAMKELFRRFRPFICKDLSPEAHALDFIYDFYVLMQADVVATNTSSFSQMAARLNRRATCLVTIDAARTGLEPFDPWPAHPAP